MVSLFKTVMIPVLDSWLSMAQAATKPVVDIDDSWYHEHICKQSYYSWLLMLGFLLLGIC